MKNHNFIGKTRYFFVVLMLVAITVSSAMVPEYATAKTHTKKELKQEVKQLTSKIKMNNRKMRAQTKGLTEIFGSIVSYNPFIIKDFVGNYYYVTNPSVLASRFLLSDVYAKRSSNYKTFYLSNEGYVNCQVIKAKRLTIHTQIRAKISTEEKKCQKTLKNRIVFSYWKAIYPKGSKMNWTIIGDIVMLIHKKIKWKSNHPSIARVDKKGYITARKVGSAVITAKSSISGKKSKIKNTGQKNPYVKFDKSVYNFPMILSKIEQKDYHMTL